MTPEKKKEIQEYWRYVEKDLHGEPYSDADDERMEALEELISDEAMDAISDLYGSIVEEKELKDNDRQMPTPHDENAIVVFYGGEMPFAMENSYFQSGTWGDVAERMKRDLDRIWMIS